MNAGRHLNCLTSFGCFALHSISHRFDRGQSTRLQQPAVAAGARKQEYTLQLSLSAMAYAPLRYDLLQSETAIVRYYLKFYHDCF
ncbi:hypothetical protein QUA35_22325 [Microcoleus sp. N9_B2]|uniref:hypothetical protein n=1 Tax=unclassified Microcoleus TaxID=2642155 RepID=UPI002FD52C56